MQHKDITSLVVHDFAASRFCHYLPVVRIKIGPAVSGANPIVVPLHDWVASGSKNVMVDPAGIASAPPKVAG